MPYQVCNGATLRCSFGIAPAVLSVAPLRGVLVSGQPAASIGDHQPLANIGTFGLCTSLANPAVAAATTAALSVLTPQPCAPVTIAPWTTGAATVTIGAQPALDDTGQCCCLWGGLIQITTPGPGVPASVP